MYVDYFNHYVLLGHAAAPRGDDDNGSGVDFGRSRGLGYTNSADSQHLIHGYYSTPRLVPPHLTPECLLLSLLVYKETVLAALDVLHESHSFQTQQQLATSKHPSLPSWYRLQIAHACLSNPIHSKHHRVGDQSISYLEREPLLLPVTCY